MVNIVSKYFSISALYLELLIKYKHLLKSPGGGKSIFKSALKALISFPVVRQSSLIDTIAFKSILSMKEFLIPESIFEWPFPQPIVTTDFPNTSFNFIFVILFPISTHG